MTQYIEIDADGFAVALYNNRNEPPTGIDGHSYYPMDVPMQFIPDGPTPSQRLKWVGKGMPLEWHETATLEEIKARKNAEIDKARESANQSYFDFAGHRIGCEEMSWKDILSTNAEIALTQQMPDGWVGGWKTKDKSPDGAPVFVPIPDVATWVRFIQAMVSRGQAHFFKSQDLKAQLTSAATPEEVAAIRWDASV